jgi:hypothetical protein
LNELASRFGFVIRTVLCTLPRVTKVWGQG